MSQAEQLTPVASRPGVPLYRDVQDAIVDAIRSGVFAPGDRIPNTKALSEQLSVSLVTAHRAMQELVAAGYLDRKQGRGTYVRERAAEMAQSLKVGIVLNPKASMADFYHYQILAGMCEACRAREIELLIMHPNEQAERGCQGFMCVNPTPEDLELICQQHLKNKPILVVGERVKKKGITTIDVDNIDLARRAVEHLYQQGHRRLAYVGSNNERTHSRDRRNGFMHTCEQLGLQAKDASYCEAQGWRMTDDEKADLGRLLNRKDRPTAVLAGGYYLALDVYAAASQLGIEIPSELSVIGVDDPPSAGHLSPALTTMRQPLIELGLTAVTTLEEAIKTGTLPEQDQILRAELVIRQSTAAN